MSAMKRFKKMLALGAAAALLTVLLGSPAQAAHHGKNRYWYSYGQSEAYVDVMVNTSDFHPKIEALSDSGSITISVAEPDIRYDWVHLYKNGNYVDLSQDFSTGWQDIGTSASTGWMFWSCGSTATWRAVAKFQIRFNNGSGALTAWQTKDSDTVSNWC